MNSLESLRSDLEILVRESAVANSPRWREALLRVDAMARQPEANLPARLHHFLERRSYEKALAFLKEFEADEA